MKLAHLEQQVAELDNSTDLEWNSGSFSKRIVFLHSSISGAAVACRDNNVSLCGSKLATLIIQVVAFPSQFPGWGDIWGAQTLDNFKTEDVGGGLWEHLHKLHQLVAGIVGGRSDIILLFKILQVARAAAKDKGIELVDAIEEQMDSFRIV